MRHNSENIKTKYLFSTTIKKIYEEKDSNHRIIKVNDTKWPSSSKLTLIRSICNSSVSIMRIAITIGESTSLIVLVLSCIIKRRNCDSQRSFGTQNCNYSKIAFV